MPEIAEVCLTSQILDSVLYNQSLKRIDISSQKYLRQSPVGYKDFSHSLPLKLYSVESKGKFMWFTLGNKQKWYIWNSFGLTGGWSLKPTSYDRLIFYFSDIVIYYYDMRNFGTFHFINDNKLMTQKLNSLGPDFLKQNFDIDIVSTISKPIVKILMNQKTLGSGLGNYLTAEILYRSQISPYRLGTSLSKNEKKRLQYWIKYLVKLAYTYNRIGYMQNLLFTHKLRKKNYHPEIKLKESSFRFLVYRQKTDPKGNPVVKDKIVGSGSTFRTTYWVPKIQR